MLDKYHRSAAKVGGSGTTDQEEPMGWHVRVAGAVCGMALCWSAPAFAAQQTLSVGQYAGLPAGADVRFWDRALDGFTVPLGPTWLDPWPNGPCLKSPTTEL